jgi:NAD(P)-dependent dehydrogenase (short-subunit alcohol dehydrogenase family)
MFWTEKDMPDLSGKTYLVTGSSSGMGFETARALSQHNAHVIMAARNKEKLDKAAVDIKAKGGKGKLDTMELDLTSFRSIAAFADKYKKTGNPLDVLVNNAGVFLPPHDHTQEGFEVTVGTNYFGHFYLTHLLLNKLTQSAPARIVFMSSTFENLGMVDWVDLEMKRANESGIFEYATSKLMKIMFAWELNRRLKGSGVDCFSVAPGLVSSPLYNKADHKKLSTIVIQLSRLVYGQSTQRGALPMMRAATDPELTGKGGTFLSPPFIYLVPFHFDNAGIRSPNNKYAYDVDAQHKLYEETLAIVNEKAKGKGLPTISAVLAQAGQFAGAR